MIHSRRHHTGYTILELVIAIAVAAALMLVATPNFITYQRNSELTTVANSMLAAVSAARTEAMKRNLPAIIQPTGSDWTSGWRVFVDVNRSGAFDAGDILVNSQEALKPYLRVTGTGNAAAPTPFLQFDGSGYARSSSTLAFERRDVIGEAVYEQTRHLIVALTGRARVCRPSGVADATCRAGLSN